MEKCTVRGKITMLRRVDIGSENFTEIKVHGPEERIYVTYRPSPGNEPNLDEEVEVTLST